jgi:SAM-dependent methyltransferase
MGSRYESVVIDAIPDGCRRALDVGCGNGELSRELHRRIPEITGLDRDDRCIQRCRSHPDAGDIRYVVNDLRTADLTPKGFELVSAVASLHHMDAGEGLVRLRSLIAPGGVLVVVGVARPDLPRDLPIEVAAQIAGLVQRRPTDLDGGPPTSIIWPPREHQVRRQRPPGVGQRRLRSTSRAWCMRSKTGSVRHRGARRNINALICPRITRGALVPA